MSIESITTEYKLKNNLTVLSDYDEKLIRSIQKLRNGYAEELSKRKCSVFLKEPVLVSVFDNKNTEKEIKKTKVKNTSAVNICEAIQMNGNRCKSKAKLGDKFCGRHCKK